MTTSIDDLTKTSGEWLRNTGPLSDVVISSRVRLARNLSGYPFLAKASESERTEIYRSAIEAAGDEVIGDGAIVVDVDVSDAVEREVLVERHLISKQLCEGEGSRGVVVSADETCALMINEEDHLRIQGLRSGLQLEPLWAQINRIDDELEKSLPYAFDEQFGYLTACPTNVGTGIRVSVMLHLPALKLTREIERVVRAARDLRLAVRGLYGEGTEAIGDLYQISNQTTLGKSEEEIISQFGEGIIPQIVDYEVKAREALVRDRSAMLDDRIWRSYAVLSQARMISSEETQARLSPIRMGIHMGRFTTFDIDTLNDLFLSTQPAHLQKAAGRTLGEEERSVRRADLMRERMAK